MPMTEDVLPIEYIHVTILQQMYDQSNTYTLQCYERCMTNRIHKRNNITTDV